MRTTILGTALLIGMLGASFANAEEKELTTQQQKMVTCSAQAKEKALKGAERRTFMSDCLKADRAAKNAQHQKMKDCNKQAAGKTGADRKKFMSECLGAHAA